VITRKPQSKGSLTKQSQDKNQAQKEARDQILHMNFNLDIPEKLSERGDLDSCLGQTDREVEAELIKHVDEAKAQYKKRQAEFK
jgi:hypothetical protein